MAITEKCFLPIRVTCYAGYRGEQTPERFYLGARCIEVITVLDQWLDPDYRYFKLKGNDSSNYILRHITDSEIWELTMFDSGKKDDSRLSST